MRRSLVGAACAVAFVTLPFDTAASSTTTCRGHLGPGSFGHVVVPPGASCSIGGIAGATSLQSLRVRPGAGPVDLNRTTIRGDLRYSGRISLAFDIGSTVGRDIEVTNAAGSILLANAVVSRDVRIEGSRLTRLRLHLMWIEGSLKIKRTSIAGTCPQACTMLMSTVKKDVLFSDNRTAKPFRFEQATIGGELACSGNLPVPVGEENMIGRRRGQCRAMG